MGKWRLLRQRVRFLTKLCFSKDHKNPSKKVGSGQNTAVLSTAAFPVHILLLLETRKQALRSLQIKKPQMSLPRAGDGTGANTPPLESSSEQKQEQQQVQTAEEDAVGSSTWRRLSENNSPVSHSFLPQKKSKVEESDDDLFTVPDVEAPPPTNTAIISNVFGNGNRENNAEIQHQTGLSMKRRRGRNPVDKEYRRLKRLLRNRVSAQQARERKKVYVNDLESRAQELLDKNSKLEEKISTLINENTMLRKVLINTRPKNDESIDPKQDHFSKS
ncbi:hypothetical protein I3760_01G123500 [Carya illinoinensis]|nr:hypothetical protein I3760_01G123500 [Carya illinoinensis]